jgi:WXG100 family type VII secretion target
MSDPGMIAYRFGEIEALAGQIGLRIQNFEALVEEMNKQVDGVTAAFDGSSTDAFRATKAKFTAAHNDMVQVLAQIKIAVSHSNDDARATEMKNAGRFGG